jgi:uncharacterized protein YeeX (DUF496 family)
MKKLPNCPRCRRKNTLFRNVEDGEVLYICDNCWRTFDKSVVEKGENNMKSKQPRCDWCKRFMSNKVKSIKGEVICDACIKKHGLVTLPDEFKFVENKGTTYEDKLKEEVYDIVKKYRGEAIRFEVLNSIKKDIEDLFKEKVEEIINTTVVDCKVDPDNCGNIICSITFTPIYSIEESKENEKNYIDTVWSKEHTCGECEYFCSVQCDEWHFWRKARKECFKSKN